MFGCHNCTMVFIKEMQQPKLFDIRYVSEITDVNGGQIFGDFFEVKFKTSKLYWSI